METKLPQRPRPFRPRVYVPTLTFFHEGTEDLDLVTQVQHTMFLARAGVAGIVVQGSTGEAVHLSRGERIEVIRTTRRALDDAGYGDLPVIAGTGAQSTREAIQLSRDAANAGADAVLVLPPAYFKNSMSLQDIRQFFFDVAEDSPLPLIIYNYPGVVNGIDLTAEDINVLAAHPRIVGCKLTCGNVGKLQRITAKQQGSDFMAMGGLADITVPVLTSGGFGVIAGLANIAPKACVHVHDLHTAGDTQSALKVQRVVADGDWGVISGGVPGTKAALRAFYGYGGYARRPLPRLVGDESKVLVELFRSVHDLEMELQ